MVALFPLICLVLTMLFIACLPIALYWRVRKTLAPDWRGAVAGIAVFTLCMMVVRGLDTYLMKAGWLSNPVIFVAYITLALGACEETGRYIAMQMLYRRAVKSDGYDARTGRAEKYAEKSTHLRSTGFGYGIGHGGAEIWLGIVLPKLQWLIPAVYASVTNAGESSMDLASLSLSYNVWLVIGAVSTFVFQIGTSVLMWRGVRAGWKSILPLVILVHGLLVLPFALRHIQAVSFAFVAVVNALGAIIVAFVLWRVYRADRLALEDA